MARLGRRGGGQLDRRRLTAYDTGYVALAERLTASPLTCDGKYTTIPGLRCAVELIG